MKRISPISGLKAAVGAISLWAIVGFVDHASAAGDAPVGGAVHLQRVAEAAEGGNRQFLCQNEVDLKPDEGYVLTFWAKSPQSTPLRVSMKVSQAPWSSVGSPQQVELTPEWQKYELNIEATGAVPGKTRITFNFVDTLAADIWMADFHLRNAGSDESENLIANARFEDGLAKWYSEGQRAGVFQVSAQSQAEAAAP
jgi:hypothetical protein